jgi:hypothetical protein
MAAAQRSSLTLELYEPEPEEPRRSRSRRGDGSESPLSMSAAAKPPPGLKKQQSSSSLSLEQGGVARGKMATEDLEHLFGGTDLSTAVKALYESGAPHEFFQLAERFIRRKDKEIETVCSRYYQEFIRSNQSLLGVRTDIREIQAEVARLNHEIQDSGAEYVRRCEALIELRQVQRHAESAVAELRRCRMVLELCARASEQMSARQYYPALRTLQSLESQYYPRDASMAAGILIWRRFTGVFENWSA